MVRGRRDAISVKIISTSVLILLFVVQTIPSMIRLFLAFSDDFSGERYGMRQSERASEQGSKTLKERLQEKEFVAIEEKKTSFRLEPDYKSLSVELTSI